MALEILAMVGSTASFNYCQMGLNRAALKECVRNLHNNRREQVVLANIICATRFKYFQEDGKLLHVQCPNGCGQMDSLDHLLACYKMEAIQPDWSFDDKVSFLSNMARVTAKNCPLLPIPIPEPVHAVHLAADEISLLGSPGASDPRLGSSILPHEDEVPDTELEFDDLGEA